MKRLMIAAALMLATSSLSVWAQSPATDTDKPQAAPAQTMPMANCPASGSTMIQKLQGCPMADGEKSPDGALPMHRMMHGEMMHGAQHPGGHECCKLSDAEKPK